MGGLDLLQVKVDSNMRLLGHCAAVLVGFILSARAAHVAAAAAPVIPDTRPNLVYILNDDTDLLLGSPDAGLTQTRRLLGGDGAGVTFSHFRTLSPKCTPSRTGQLAGRHYHNVRPAGAATSRKSGRGLNQTTMFDGDALFPALHSAGYWTSIVGKVHNGQQSFLCTPKHNRTTPFTHVATLCKPCGNYWGNQYVVKNVGDEHTHMEAKLDPTAWSTYSHGQFGNRSAAFIRQAVAAGKPFFAYIGTTGPHLPSMPAPWHASTVASWGDDVRAPRLPNFNYNASDSHPTLAALPPIDPDKTGFVDQNHRDRVGVLLSIDDLTKEIVSTLQDVGVLDNTYILFSADHGYHLGNWRLPQEKMWPFETDVRIPFYMRGPGIAAGSTVDVMALNLDIAATLLDFAGLDVPASYDGRSMRPLVVSDAGDDAVTANAKMEAARDAWRTKTVISFAEGANQYWHAVSAIGAGDVDDPQATTPAPQKSNSGLPYTFDNPENQWRMLRVANSTHDFALVEWDPKFVFDDIAFTALYDVNKDPHQLHNIWTDISTEEQALWHSDLVREFSCKGTKGPLACS